MGSSPTVDQLETRKEESSRCFGWRSRVGGGGYGGRFACGGSQGSSRRSRTRAGCFKVDGRDWIRGIGSWTSTTTSSTSTDPQVEKTQCWSTATRGHGSTHKVYFSSYGRFSPRPILLLPPSLLRLYHHPTSPSLLPQPQPLAFPLPQGTLTTTSSLSQPFTSCFSSRIESQRGGGSRPSNGTSILRPDRLPRSQSHPSFPLHSHHRNPRPRHHLLPRLPSQSTLRP